jgi:ribosomal protein S18 acetylase RimI-like enzyme
MQILKAEYQDIPALVALMDHAYRGEESKQGWSSEADLFEGNKRTDEATVAGLMENPENIFLKCCTEAGVMEGCVCLQKKGTRIYLGMLTVSPAAQGKGIGKLLLEAAGKHAVEQNCKSIYMSVITIRTELIAWYERHGYKKTGERIPFPVEERFGVPKKKLEMFILEKIM